MTGVFDARGAIADEYRALADLLEAAEARVWDAPLLCEGWRTREVVADVTMPARYDGPTFMAELEAAGGDFTRLSDVIAARDGALPADTLVADLRSPVLHGWEPPGGGTEGALTHCVIHALDVVEAVPLPRHVPDASIRSVLRSWPRRAHQTCSASTSAPWSCGRTTWTGHRAPAPRWRGRRRRWSSSPPAGGYHRAACTARRQPRFTQS